MLHKWRIARLLSLDIMQSISIAGNVKLTSTSSAGKMIGTASLGPTEKLISGVARCSNCTALAARQRTTVVSGSLVNEVLISPDN